MLKNWLKRIYYRLKYYNKKVSIGAGVVLDRQTWFEGFNDIAINAIVTSCRIGKGSYISRNSIIKRTVIGRFCSIGTNVQTCLGLHPSRQFVSTHPAFFSTQKQAGFTFAERELFNEHIYLDKENKFVVDIGNDVWIGSNVMIMDGVTIGDGAIIAAGSVVTKNVPPYAIVGGLPAKLIRYRFTDEEIVQLNKIKWWDWSIDKLKANSHLFNNVEVFISHIGAERQRDKQQYNQSAIN